MVSDEEVRNFIRHFADQYYDPVKAHEYYMRTRKLKGRQQAFSTKGFSEKQKQAWAYIKDRIRQEQKANSVRAQQIRDANIKKAHENAVALREDLAYQLIMLDGRLPSGSNGAAERARIASDLKAVIAKFRDKYKADRKAASVSAKGALAAEFGKVKTKVR